MMSVIASANVNAAISIGPDCDATILATANSSTDTQCCDIECDDDEDDEEAISNTSSSTTFSIEDEKTIGITLSSDSIVLDINPTSSGVFKSTSMTIDVSTNNPTGYNLTMTADKTNLSRTSKINGETPTIPTIPTGKTFTETSFETGYWGYKIGTNTNYLPMTTAAIAINTTEAAANSSVNTITFASKLDNSIPSGTYSGITLSFVATTNPEPVLITNRTYLQDFAGLSGVDKATLLTSMKDGETYIKKDNRDQKDYTIARLADGNVWMTSNLDLAANTTITNANSNIFDASYTLPANSTSGTADFYDVANFANRVCEGTPCYSYYSYTVATAGTNPSSGDAEYDICPRGWRLPKINEFQALIDAYGATSNGALLAASPVNMVYGRYYGATRAFASSDEVGVYRTSYASDSTKTITFNVRQSGGSISYGNNKPDGASIRCILKNE